MCLPRLAGAVLLILSACAAPSRLKLADGSLDGLYAGNRTTDSSCGAQSQTVAFTVSGSAIASNNHNRRHRLEGTVAANGQIALHDLAGHRLIEGQINGTALTASETDQPSGKKNYKARDVLDPQGMPCVWRYEAIRVSAG